MNGLKILSENRINAQAVLAATSGSGLTNLYDQKPATCWRSSGSADTVTETLTAAFANRLNAPAAYEFDRIILLKNNLKSLSAEYVSGGVAHAIAEAAISDNDEENLIIELATTVTADQLNLSAITTVTADAEKQLGELKVCKQILEVIGLTNFQRADWRKGGDFRTRDGSLVRWTEAQKQEGTLTIENISLAQRDALNEAIGDNDFLTFVFYSDFDPAAVYEFAVTSAPQEEFDRKTQYFQITLSLKER